MAEEFNFVTADPNKPASTFVHGWCAYLSLRVTKGPLFKGQETKFLNTGLSLATSAPAVTCLAQRLPQGRTPSALSVPFTVLTEPEDFINVVLPVRNTSKLPKNSSDSEDQIFVTAFALPLASVQLNEYPLFRQNPGFKPEFEQEAHQTNAEQLNDSHLIKVTHRRVRWTQSKKFQFSTHHTTITATLPRSVPANTYVAAELKAISDPMVRLDSSILIPRPEETAHHRLRIQLVFDGHADDAKKVKKPPTSLTVHVLLHRDAIPFALRHFPYKSLERITTFDNGYRVMSPMKIEARKGTTWTINIDNGYSCDGRYTGVFFPKYSTQLDIEVCRWIETRTLNISVTALADVVIPVGLELGRVYFFANRLTQELITMRTPPVGIINNESLSISIPQYECKLFLPVGSEAYRPGPDPAYDDLLPEATVRRRLSSVDRAAAAEAASADVLDHDQFAQLSLNTPRPVGRELPPRRTSADERLFAQMDADNVPSDQEGEEDDDEAEVFVDEEEFDEERNWVYNAVPESYEEEATALQQSLTIQPNNFLRVRAANLSTLTFTMHTPLINEGVYFNEAMGIDKVAVQLTTKGRYGTRPMGSAIPRLKTADIPAHLRP
ncbi:M82 protein [Murid betaherpesvirus 1]|nr:M82 protein [Murid betaherpesvirus 1]